MNNDKNYREEYHNIANKYSDLSNKYNDLVDEYIKKENELEKALSDYKEEKKLNNELINDMLQITKNTEESQKQHINILQENVKLKQAQSHGAFIEFNNNKSESLFIPFLGSFDTIENDPSVTHVYYTFSMDQLSDWFNKVNFIMNKKNGLLTDEDVENIT
jgi:uncharacterized protein YhaN